MAQRSRFHLCKLCSNIMVKLSSITIWAEAAILYSLKIRYFGTLTMNCHFQNDYKISVVAVWLIKAPSHSNFEEQFLFEQDVSIIGLNELIMKWKINTWVLQASPKGHAVLWQLGSYWRDDSTNLFGITTVALKRMNSSFWTHYSVIPNQRSKHMNLV